jgi:hypothetical protein
MRKIKLVLVVSLLILGTSSTSMAQAALLQRLDLLRADSVRDLWLDVSLGPPLIDWFNRVARPDDIARIEQVKQVDLLDEITVGRKLVVFKSVDEAEHYVPEIADRIDIIGYNLEHGPGYSSREQADPVDSAKRMHDLAQEYDLMLAFGPDHDFALSDGAALAPYVDIFVLQVQRVQTEPDTVVDFVLPLIRQLRQANPELEVSVQVRSEGDVVAIVDLIDDIKDSLDGVSILTSPETVEITEELVTVLRMRKTVLGGPVRAQATLAATSKQGDGLTKAEATTSTQPVTMVGPVIAGAVAGFIGGGLAAFWLCSRRRVTRK